MQNVDMANNKSKRLRSLHRVQVRYRFMWEIQESQRKYFAKVIIINIRWSFSYITRLHKSYFQVPNLFNSINLGIDHRKHLKLDQFSNTFYSKHFFKGDHYRHFQLDWDLLEDHCPHIKLSVHHDWICRDRFLSKHNRHSRSGLRLSVPPKVLPD